MKIQQTENTVTPIGDYNQTHTQTHTLAHQQKVKQILNLKTKKKVFHRCMQHIIHTNTTSWQLSENAEFRV